MSRLIESIRLQDGVFGNLEYHQRRMDYSVSNCYHQQNRWKLEDILSGQVIPQQGLYKCRVLYSPSTIQVEFLPYDWKPVVTLKVIQDDQMEYAHKWENRSSLLKAWNGRGPCDDVLIIRNGLVTDSSYANIVFKGREGWVTPDSFLLNGTMRQYLLDSRKISEAPVRLEDIHRFTSFKLINALLKWDFPESDVANIG